MFEEESVFTRAQRPKEKIRDYIVQMQKLAKRIPTLDDDLLLWVILKGLRPQIKASVIHQKAEIISVADILELAKIAESAGLGKADESIDDPLMNQLMDEIRAGREEVQQLTAKVARMSVSSAQPRSPTPECRQTRCYFKFQIRKLQCNVLVDLHPMFEVDVASKANPVLTIQVETASFLSQLQVSSFHPVIIVVVLMV